MNVRTITALGATALAVGLIAGCATRPAENASATASPSVSATPSRAPFHSDAVDEAIASAKAEESAEALLGDVSILIDYRKVVSDFQSILDDLQGYVNDNDLRGAMSLGDDFASLAQDGLDLEDAPNLGVVGNKAWDDAMSDYQDMGDYLTLGMPETAGKSMDKATEHIEVAVAAMAANS